MKMHATSILTVLLLMYSGCVLSVSLEETDISAADIRKSRNVRDNTEAPMSVVGGWAHSTAKAMAEACKDGKCNTPPPALNNEVISAPSKIGNFECTFVCIKHKSLIDSVRSEEQRIKVSASDKRSANDIGWKNAEQWCERIGYGGLYSRWGKGSIDCN